MSLTVSTPQVQVDFARIFNELGAARVIATRTVTAIDAGTLTIVQLVEGSIPNIRDRILDRVPVRASIPVARFDAFALYALSQIVPPPIDVAAMAVEYDSARSLIVSMGQQMIADVPDLRDRTYDGAGNETIRIIAGPLVALRAACQAVADQLL